MIDIVMWQDIVKELKARSGLVLMYLAFGEDCPYNMAETFKNGLIPKHGWDEKKVKGFKTLMLSNELGKLLDKMETNGLLISRHEEEGRKRHFYHLDPMILCEFSSTSKLFLTPLNKIINIYAFLEKLEEKVQTPGNKKLEQREKELGDYFKLWSSFGTYDYNTFILFLEIEAEKIGMDDMKDSLRKFRYQYSNFDNVSREIDYQDWINRRAKK
ncbi:MAG: hypothetical protein XD72_2215 [Methanothrix harundinacea]|jgi:hypothetical protein|uniref:Uncharacterized protein n=1 Tax=Methanothrix harundinacea TaxID=301375 RepID=A0A117LEX3_9EURY|nr:MAG: hypothetical protein XD72_2215 [Methanothrix harundinacea]